MKKSAYASASAVLGIALMALAPAYAQQSRLEGLKLSGDQPIQIESDRLEVRENDKVAVFSGNVNAAQGKTVLKAGKLTVYYAGEGSATTGSADIDRIEASGKVYVSSDGQTATGDTGSFDMKSEVLVLSGKEVVLSDGKNVVAGCQLIVQMRTGLANVKSCPSGSGRVRILIDPKSRP